MLAWVCRRRSRPFGPRARGFTVQLDPQRLATASAFRDQGTEQRASRSAPRRRAVVQQVSAPTGFVEALRLAWSTARLERPAKDHAQARAIEKQQVAPRAA